MYKEHTRLELVEGGNVFKQGDELTLSFKARDEKGRVIDLEGKTIEGAIFSIKTGVIYEASAAWNSSNQTIEFKIDELLDHGRFEIEFTVTSTGYRLKIPSSGNNATLQIKPSTDDIDYVGVSKTTVTQLRHEQEAQQQQFEGVIVPKVNQIETQFNEVLSGATADGEVQAARIGPDGTYSTIGQRMDATTTQLADSAKINKTASSLGLVPNDANAATDNFAKIILAMREGYRIVIENHYYLSGSETNPILKDISMIGVGGLITIVTASTSISFNGNLNVEFLDFEAGFTGSPSPVFKNDTDTAIDKINISHCDFKGDIFGVLLDRSDFTFPNKIKKITFDDNRILDRSANFAIINGIDFDALEITENKVRNMSLQVFNINNTVNPKALTNIKGNTVLNDFDHWSTVSSMYLCFVLYKGAGKVVYKNNEVKGLKTKVDNVAVYDAYLSCDDLDYDNNIWEDNITVAPVRGKNSLFKAKEGFADSIYRSCRNNKFRMSKKLIDSLTASEKERCYVTPWDFVAPLTYFSFEGNDIDVYHLLQNEYDQSLLFSFHKNSVRAEKITGFLINMEPMVGSKLSLIGNSVKSSGVTPADFYREYSTSPTLQHEEVIFEDNSITMAFNQLFYGIKAKKFIYNNVVVENLNTTSIPSIIHYGKIGKLIGVGNKLTTPTDMAFVRDQSVVEELDFSMETNRKTYSFGNNTTTISFDSSKESAKQVVANYNILSKTEQLIFNLFFELGEDTTGLYAKYKDASGVQQTARTSGTFTASVDKINNFAFAITARVVLNVTNKTIAFRVDVPQEVVEKFQVKSFVSTV